jgi:peptidoglycan hydrolase-like protein with peptidoglycan-binding domain
LDLQEDLAYLGCEPGPIDGVLGPLTRAAVEAYKRDKGLNPNMADDEAFSLISTEVLRKRHKELDALFQVKQRTEPPPK